MPRKIDIKEAVKFEQNAIGQRNQEDLKKTVEYLIKMREEPARPINIYVEFQGHRLYSADVTMDSAFLDVYGYRYEDYRRYSPDRYPKASQEEKDRLNGILEKKRESYRKSVRDKAICIAEYKGKELRRVVEFLQDCKRNGHNVSINFNGCMLYSEYVTYSDASAEVLKNRTERLMAKQAALEEAEKQTKIWKPGMKVTTAKGPKKLTKEDPEL